MRLLAALDRKTMPLKRRIANAIAPDPRTLGHPTFRARIVDRRRRWQKQGEANPYNAIASKIDGNSYMRSLGYAVPEVYGVYPTLDDIPQWKDLPRNFVLKPTHGWSNSGVFLMRDGVSSFDNRPMTRDELILAARAGTGKLKNGIAGSWIAEELLVNFDGQTMAPVDHKFFCFGPDIVALHITKRNSIAQTQKNQHWFLDPDWRQLPRRLNWDFYPEPSAVQKPPFLGDMMKIASDVGGRLNIFLRIDMYATTRGPVFGEFTAYPFSGLGYTPWGNAWLGAHWKTRDGGIDVLPIPQTHQA